MGRGGGRRDGLKGGGEDDWVMGVCSLLLALGRLAR